VTSKLIDIVLKYVLLIWIINVFVSCYLTIAGTLFLNLVQAQN
jgi:hypothetical protein